MTIEQDIVLLVDSSKTPHIVWRNADTNEIQLAVQNGSTWDETTLVTDANGSQFGAVMADNGSIGLMYRHDTSGLVTEWLEGAADSWSMTERTVLSSNETLVDGEASVQLSGSALEVVWEDNNSQWRHQFSESGSVTDQSMPSLGWTAPMGSPEFTSDGFLIPGALVNTSGSHVLIARSQSTHLRAINPLNSAPCLGRPILLPLQPLIQTVLGTSCSRPPTTTSTFYMDWQTQIVISFRT